MKAGRVGQPQPAAVGIRDDGVPRMVDGSTVEAIREDWLVEDSWWTRRPLKRRYYELILDGGRRVVVFCDLVAGHWWKQRA
jgi:hypothetical protein